MATRAYQKSRIDPKTAQAMAELGRAAARVAGIPDDVVITMEILPDRDYEWCGLQDDYCEVTEEDFCRTKEPKISSRSHRSQEEGQ
jgi:hypothetical protein